MKVRALRILFYEGEESWVRETFKHNAVNPTMILTSGDRIVELAQITLPLESATAAEWSTIKSLAKNYSKRNINNTKNERRNT